ncbi:RICIN domain-containing protein [Streptomyces olindensis]|uniref:RICIN domain-containing protein n=1 Tax=Streptomyces olindensis TaxID=358823 RepID=UPI0033C2905F
MANQSLPPAVPQVSVQGARPEDELLEEYREAVLCYATLCTTSPAEAVQLAYEAFTLGIEWRRQGEQLPWLPLLLMAVLEMAGRWQMQGRGEPLSTELSIWLYERVAQQHIAPEQPPLALRALQQMPTADAELLWAAEVEGLHTKSDAGGRPWEVTREWEVTRVREAFRQCCQGVYAAEVADSDEECRGYLGLLEAATRSPEEWAPEDLQRHLAGCARCSETAACLTLSDESPVVLATGVLGWGGREYLDRRRIAGERDPAGPAHQEDQRKIAGWRAPLRRRPVWAAGAVILLAVTAVVGVNLSSTPSEPTSTSAARDISPSPFSSPDAAWPFDSPPLPTPTPVPSDVSPLADADSGVSPSPTPAPRSVSPSPPAKDGKARTRPSRIVGRGSGRCLDNTDNGPIGTQQQIRDCGIDDPDQKYTYTAARELRVAGKCLAAENNGTAEGTRVVSWTCNATPGQRWTFKTDGTITNDLSGKCLDVTDVGTANGSKIQLYWCWGGSNQLWSRR